VRKDHAGAEAAYRKAIELDPTNAVAHNNLGILLMDVRKDHAGAEAAFRKAIELDPTDAVAHNNLGNLLKNVRKDYAGAEAAYRKAIELDPTDAAAHWNLSTLLETRGDIAGAILAMQDYIEAGDPDNDGKKRIEALRSKVSSFWMVLFSSPFSKKKRAAASTATAGEEPSRAASLPTADSSSPSYTVTIPSFDKTRGCTEYVIVTQEAKPDGTKATYRARQRYTHFVLLHQRLELGSDLFRAPKHLFPDCSFRRQVFEAMLQGLLKGAPPNEVLKEFLNIQEFAPHSNHRVHAVQVQP